MLPEDFGEFRALLAGPPGEQTWARLGELLAVDHLDRALDDPLLVYCAGQLAHWPASTPRPVPEPWWGWIVGGVELRDVYLEARREKGGRGELLERIGAHVRPEATILWRGIAVWFHPTRTHRLLRFLEAEALPRAWRPAFARPLPELPDVCAVFVDPEEFHFRTFANIHPLDRLVSEAQVASLELGPARARAEPRRSSCSARRSSCARRTF